MEQRNEIGGIGSAIMHIMDSTGDTKVMWNPRDADEVKNAEETFDRLRGRGFRAFRVKRNGEQGEQITTFDKDAEKIIFVPQLAGG